MIKDDLDIDTVASNSKIGGDDGSSNLKNNNDNTKNICNSY